MISGTVSPSLHPCIRLDVQADDGSFRSVEFVVDTAFNAMMALPDPSIALLGLPWHHQDRRVLADGTTMTTEVHRARIIWDGKAMPVWVDAGGPLPLVGTLMLQDHDLKVRTRVGGDVTIERIP
jgi:clan AA aspartic protease